MKVLKSLLCALGLAVGTLAPCWATANEDAAHLSFQIQVADKASRYTDLLQYPSYLAVAFENAGIRATNAGRIILVDRTNLQFRNVSISFVEKKGGLIKYKSHIQWDLAMTQMTFDIPFEVDLRDLAKGRVEVRFYPKGASLLPDALVQKMQLKIQTVASESAQAALLSYLDKVMLRNANRGLEGVLETILIDSYNLPVDLGSGCKEFGDAEPVQDQYYLIATLVLWFIAVPMGIGVSLWRRRRKMRGAGKS